MDTNKYLNTITYADRIADTSKPPITVILPRDATIPERDWNTTIYREYAKFTIEEDRLTDLNITQDIYSIMLDTFTINGKQWNQEPVRKNWYKNNNDDLRIQMSELINTTIKSLKSRAPTPLLYGKPQKLLCLSYSTPGSEPIMAMMYPGTIKLDQDIRSSKVPADFTNKIIDTMVGLLYTSPEMCTYQMRPLTRTFSNRSDVLMRFKAKYINGDGMNTAYGADLLKSYIEGPTPPFNRYCMALWDIEKHIIAGWILFEVIYTTDPDTYTSEIHKYFDKYIHITAFCGNIPAGSTGATTFIAMLMDLCKKNPTVYPGIILDSVTNIETILLYYSLGFRSVLYHADPTIPNSNTAVFVKGEQLMVWNADPTGTNFPSTEYDIHPSTPSVLLDRVRKYNRHGIWTRGFEPKTRYLDDIRAFIAIATKGYPLKPYINGIAVEDVRYIHQSELYKRFKKWMKNHTNTTIKRFEGKGKGKRLQYHGGDGPESLVPYVYTKPSSTYQEYINGTLNNPIYRVDDPTFLNINIHDSPYEDETFDEVDDENEYDADDEYETSTDSTIPKGFGFYKKRSRKNHKRYTKKKKVND